MKLGLKALLAALLAAALAVPAATAKPGGSHGHGNGGGAGKPSWAGHGAGHANGHGKKAEKVHKDHKAKGGAAAEAEAGAEEAPKHDNPAWTCKFELENMGLAAFADQFGTNTNKANAFGFCVSEEAHARNGVGEEARPEASDECHASTVDEGEAESGAADSEGQAESDEEAVESGDGGATAEDCAASDEQASEGDDEEAGDDSSADEDASAGSESPDVDAALTALRRLF